MSTWLAVWLGWAVLNGPADDRAASAPDAAPPPTTTAPADAPIPPRGGMRLRMREGQRRRELGPQGPGPGPGPGQFRGNRPPRQGPPPGLDQPLSPHDIDELMKFAHDNFPQIHERLDRLRRDKPREFQRIVQRIYARLRPLMDLAEDDPQVAEKAIQEHRLQMVITGLVEQYRAAKSDEERARLKAELEVRIHERFDRHQERIRLEIQALRKRLDEQERQLTKREQNKEELLRKELDRAIDGQLPPPGPDNPPPPGRGEKNS
jgi:hypothetical protein